jgi:opine dehydrogenase
MYPRIAKKLLMESRLWYEKIDYEHRYVTEDIACGLAFLISVADYIEVDVPIARSLITLAGVVAGTDFMKTGRTLKSLGISQMSLEKFRGTLVDGF